MYKNSNKEKSFKQSTNKKKSAKSKVKKGTQQKNITRNKSNSTISKTSKTSKMNNQNQKVSKKEMISKAKERKTVHNSIYNTKKPDFNKTQGQKDLQFTFNAEDFAEGFSYTDTSQKQTHLPLTKQPSKTSSLFTQMQSKKILKNNPFQNLKSIYKIDSHIELDDNIIAQEMHKDKLKKDRKKIYQSEKQILGKSKSRKIKNSQVSKQNSIKQQSALYNQFSINNIQQQNSIQDYENYKAPLSPNWTQQESQLRESLDSNQFLDSTDFGIQQQNMILIDFQSNYGNPKYIGLQQIKIFDKYQNEPNIKPENLKFFINNKFVHNDSLKNLINQNILITNQQRAFKAKIDSSQQNLDCSLKIELPLSFELSVILIWNYNSDYSIGAKECTIHYNTQLIYADKLQKATQTEENVKNYQVIPLQSWNLQRRGINQLLKKVFTKNRQTTPQQKYNAPHAIMNKNQNKKNIFEQQFVNSLTPKKLQKNFNISTPSKKSTQLKPIIKAEDLNSIYENSQNKSAKKLKQLKSIKSIQSRSKSREFENSIQKNLYSLQKSVYRKLEQIPIVQQLNFILVDNWGDQDEIGFNGFEFFDAQGKQIHIHSQQIKCFKQQQDQKNGNQNDIENLISGVYPTRDSNQHWKCKKDKKYKEVNIQIDFGKSIKLSMIRIWNYNCSRIKAAKGIKNIVIIANNKFTIFIGKIKKANGSLRKKVINYECILFTKDTQILRQMSVRDWLFKKQKDRNKSTNKIKETVNKNMINRPPTIDKDNSETVNYGKFKKQQVDKYNVFQHVTEELYFSNSQVQQFSSNSDIQQIKIQILETWEKSYMFEINQIEFYELENKKVSQDSIKIKSSNKSNAFDLHESFQNKKPIKFFKNQNQDDYIIFEFQKSYKIQIIKIYPSIKNDKPSLNNIKRIHIFIDNQKITKKEGLYVSQGLAGKNLQSFQNIEISKINKPKINYNFQGNWVSCMNLKIHLKSTYGDPYYIGLNEIEIFDLYGQNVLQTQKFNIQGLPPGVIIDPEMITDQRIVSNLYNKNKQSIQYKDIWLTFLTKYPVKCLNYTQNILAIQFENPITISMINIFNYIKDQKRAVKEIEIYADNKIIYSGYLYDPKINQLSTIIFSKLIQKDNKFEYKMNPIIDKEGSLIQLINEQQIIISAPQERFEDFRPLTGQDKQIQLLIYKNIQI